MNRSNRYVQLSLLSITVLLFGMFVFPGVYADEIISITIDLQTILLDGGEVIPLLNTNNIANMSKITISATLPCNSSNVPDLKIIAGVLGNTTDVIDSSSDYASLRGPFDTCYFEDTVDIDTASVPALNRIFLKNDGTSSVLTGLGTTVTLTGVFTNSTSSSESSSSGSLHDGLMYYHQMENNSNTCSNTTSTDCLAPSGTIDYHNASGGMFGDDTSTDKSGDASDYTVNWGSGDNSVCMWATTPTGDNSDYVFSSKDDNGSDNAIWIKFSTGVGIDYLTDGNVIVDTSIVPSGTYHICTTFDADGLGELWVNGVSQGTGDTSTSTLDNDKFVIGNYYNGASVGNSCESCDVDDLAIWNRVLTDAEISDIYANGAGLEIINNN